MAIAPNVMTRTGALRGERDNTKQRRWAAMYRLTLEIGP
jgi:hypothetical protein